MKNDLVSLVITSVVTPRSAGRLCITVLLILYCFWLNGICSWLEETMYNSLTHTDRERHTIKVHHVSCLIS